MKKYEVYESNAGNLTLIAYNKDGHADYIHTGYEFVRGQLKQDLQALAEGDDPATDWDGNEIGDYTAEQIAEAENGEWGELVADNDGIYLEHAGSAAYNELGGARKDDVENAIDDWRADNWERFEAGGDLSDLKIDPVCWDNDLRDFVAYATDGSGADYTLSLGSDGNIYINS